MRLEAGQGPLQGGLLEVAVAERLAGVDDRHRARRPITLALLVEAREVLPGRAPPRRPRPAARRSPGRAGRGRRRAGRRAAPRARRAARRLGLLPASQPRAAGSARSCSPRAPSCSCQASALPAPANSSCSQPISPPGLRAPPRPGSQGSAPRASRDQDRRRRASLHRRRSDSKRSPRPRPAPPAAPRAPGRAR